MKNGGQLGYGFHDKVSTGPAVSSSSRAARSFSDKVASPIANADYSSITSQGSSASTAPVNPAPRA